MRIKKSKPPRLTQGTAKRRNTMNWEQIQTTIIAVCSSTVGSAVLAFIAYIIKDAIVHKIDSKKSKLLASDKKEIAVAVQKGIQNGVEVDITSELDKATKKLVSEFKGTLNDLIALSNEDRRLLYAVAQTLAQFKTIQGTTALAELKQAIDGAGKQELAKIDDDRVVANVKVALEEPKVEEKVSKIKY